MRQENYRTAIERVLRAISELALAHDTTIHYALALVTKAIDAGDETISIQTTLRESAAATRQSQREQMIAMLLRLEGEGRGRKAVTVVARKFARDRDDDGEVENLARNLRRWRKTNPDIVRIRSSR